MSENGISRRGLLGATAGVGGLAALGGAGAARLGLMGGAGAAALATASAMKKTSLPARLVVLGEVGLAGEIRRVPNITRRLQEAARLGYKMAIIPAGDKPKVASMGVRQVATLTEALKTLR